MPSPMVRAPWPTERPEQEGLQLRGGGFTIRRNYTAKRQLLNSLRRGHLFTLQVVPTWAFCRDTLDAVTEGENCLGVGILS